MKSNRKLRLSRAVQLATLLLALVFVFTNPAVVKAQAGCTNATLNGSYGYLAQAFFLDHQRTPVGSAYAAASTGIETFDGNGNTYVSETVNASGITYHQTLTGTYSVNADCTATATLTFPDGGTATGTFTIVDGGNELELLNLGHSIVESGRFRKLFQPCTNATLNGNYGYLMQAFDQLHRRMPVGSTYAAASTGVETFDGNGNTFGSDTTNVSGIIFPPATFTGTYTVNADCTATATITFPDGGTATATLTIVDGGNELEFLNLWDSAVEFGRFRKQ